MENIKKVALKLGVVPKLQLMVKKVGGGTVTTGPHKVKVLRDVLIMGKDDKGKPQEKCRLILIEDGVQKKYDFPMIGKDGGPHYLIEQFMNVEPNTELVLEAKKTGMINYIEVRRAGEVAQKPENINDETFG